MGNWWGAFCLTILNKITLGIDHSFYVITRLTKFFHSFLSTELITYQAVLLMQRKLIEKKKRTGRPTTNDDSGEMLIKSTFEAIQTKH